jgi:hypothetical protein
MLKNVEISDQVTKGFHGTTRDAADEIIETDFKLTAPDSSPFLGEGVYFFENQLSQAKRWARRVCANSGKAAAVIRSNIRHGKLLNLTDKEQCDNLEWFANEYEHKSSTRVTLATIIDIAAEKLNVDVVKGARIWENPTRLMRTSFTADLEIILAVRNKTNILSKEIIWGEIGKVV